MSEWQTVRGGRSGKQLWKGVFGWERSRCGKIWVAAVTVAEKKRWEDPWVLVGR